MNEIVRVVTIFANVLSANQLDDTTRNMTVDVSFLLHNLFLKWLKGMKFDNSQYFNMILEQVSPELRLFLLNMN